MDALFIIRLEEFPDCLRTFNPPPGQKPDKHFRKIQIKGDIYFLIFFYFPIHFYFRTFVIYISGIRKVNQKMIFTSTAIAFSSVL